MTAEVFSSCDTVNSSSSTAAPLSSQSSLLSSSSSLGLMRPYASFPAREAVDPVDTAEAGRWSVGDAWWSSARLSYRSRRESLRLSTHRSRCSPPIKSGRYCSTTCTRSSAVVCQKHVTTCVGACSLRCVCLPSPCSAPRGRCAANEGQCQESVRRDSDVWMAMHALGHSVPLRPQQRRCRRRGVFPRWLQ
jgi:hypothetical protein